MCQGTNKLGSVTAVTWVIVKDVGKLADVTDQHDRNDIWRKRKEGRGHNDEKTKTTSTTVMTKMSSMSLINGDDLFLSTLTVGMFPLIPLVNPNMVFSPPNEIYFQNVGDTVKLNCSAGGVLVIRGFQPRDVAIYKCIFYNEKNVTAEANTSLGIHKSYSCSRNRKRKLLREFGCVL